jgi:hypothetical protein
VIGGSVEMREGSRVRGEVASIGGSAVIDGRVDGTLVVIGGTLDLRSHATIRQDFITFGAVVTRAEGAKVLGQRVEGLRWNVPPLRIRPDLSRPWVAPDRWTAPYLSFTDLVGRALRWVARTFALMALGVVAVLVLPKHTLQVGQTLRTFPLPSAGVGLLTLVALLVVTPLLVIICIGIPLVLLLAIVFVAALLLGRVAIGMMIGQRLMRELKVEQPQPLLEVVLGIGLVELLAAVPCLGGLLVSIVSLAGLGAVVLTRFGTMPYEPLHKSDELPAPAPEPELDIAPEEEQS